MKNKYNTWYRIKRVFVFLLITTSTVIAQPGELYNPETSDGAQNIHVFNFDLRWKNPISTTYNEVYLSFDSLKVALKDTSVRKLNGFPSTIYSNMLSGSLFEDTRYFYKVVEYDASGVTDGPVISFVAAYHPYWFYVKKDNFDSGLGAWTVTGTLNCKWSLGNVQNYMLPDPSYKNVFVVKNSGAPPANSTALLENIDLGTTSYYSANYSFDYDLKNDYPGNSHYLEYSTNNGTNWNVAWTKTGVTERSRYISGDLFTNPSMTGPQNIRIRLRSNLYDTTSFLAIDNFKILAATGVLTPDNVTNLHTSVTANNKVQLTFSFFMGAPNVYIFRKNGFPSSPGNYALIATIPNNQTSYLDNTVSDSSIYTYTVAIGITSPPANFAKYSNEATVYINQFTPVEMSAFYTKIQDGKILVCWTTGCETNNYGFEVERSSDKIKWTLLGFVPGNGTCSVQNDYSFTDNNSSPGRFYYRLKQLDFDGSFQYTDVIKVDNGAIDFNLWQNYPNPFNPVTKIKYSTGMNAVHVRLQVINSLGEEVAELVNETKEPGVYEVELNASRLSSGIYFYKLSAGEFSSVKKFVLLK